MYFFLFFSHYHIPKYYICIYFYYLDDISYLDLSKIIDKFFPISGRTAFEKMTDLDYVGETYYTIRNLSLYECQGWCREEPECSAASFSFAVNPNSSPPRQETVCLLQNGTQATNPSAKPLRALNQYYMVKMSVRSGNLKVY